MPSARFATCTPTRAARRAARGAAVCLTGVLAACTGPDTGAGTRALDDAGIDRDSAFVDARGQRAVVHVVASPAPAWDPGGGWRVADRPALVLDGRSDGAPFGRVTGAARFDDGGIVIADAGLSALRLYDAAGRSRGHIVDADADVEYGGFPGAGGVLLRGDTILALDVPAVVVRVTRQGERIDRRATPLLDRFGGGFSGEYVRLLADGTLLAWVYENTTRSRPDGPFRPLQGFVRMTPGDTREDTIGWYPGLEHVQRDGVARWTAFGADTDAAADDRHVYVGDARAGTIDVHDLQGNLLRRIRLQRPPVDVTAADLADFRDAFRARVMAGAGGAAVASYESMLAVLPVAPQFPAFRALLADRSGHLWVESYPWPADAPPTWSVFDAAGRWLGDVTTPPGLTLVEIGDAWLLGVRAGPTGEGRVELYPLRKPPGTRAPVIARHRHGG